MKKLFITGGNGFLGKHLQKRFREDPNYELLTPKSSELDVLNFAALSNYLAKHEPDIIFHGAAKCAGILGNKNAPADFIFQNTQMALNIYEAARQNAIKTIYSLGSVCMYPKFAPTPFKEED